MNHDWSIFRIVVFRRFMLSLYKNFLRRIPNPYYGLPHPVPLN